MGREGLPVADEKTGVSGLITYQGEPVSRAFIYIYTETDAGLTGPSYGEAVQADKEGRFTINLPVGCSQACGRQSLRGPGSR
jgi:hypothetical protein